MVFLLSYSFSIVASRARIEASGVGKSQAQGGRLLAERAIDETHAPKSKAPRAPCPLRHRQSRGSPSRLALLAGIGDAEATRCWRAPAHGLGTGTASAPHDHGMGRRTRVRTSRRFRNGHRSRRLSDRRQEAISFCHRCCGFGSIRHPLAGVCSGEGMRDAETALGWPARADKLVLTFALDRVADYYRIR